MPETVTCDKETEYVFGVKNLGFRFDSTLRFVILLGGDVKFTSEPQTFVLARGEEDTVRFKETVNLPNSNDYLVRLITGDDKTVGERKISILGSDGIDTVGIDENAPVRYFNLQGVEILTPVEGQPVIVVKGSKAVKAIF